MMPNENKSLERVLESAIIVSWTDLMHGVKTGLIYIEYGVAPTGTLEYLKVLSSITRSLALVCEYWTSANTFHRIGVRFENGYQSDGLARILEFVMQHQNAFVPPPNLRGQGLFQIPTPTEKESAAAAITVTEAIHGFGSLLAQPTVA